MNKMLNKTRFHTHLHYVISKRKQTVLDKFLSMQNVFPARLHKRGPAAAAAAAAGGLPIAHQDAEKNYRGSCAKKFDFFHFHVLQPKRTTAAYSATDRSLHCEHSDILNYKVLT